MNTLLENNSNKLLEKFLEVENISFMNNVCDDMDVYLGKNIKKSNYSRKENEISYTFPRYVSCSFTKNGKRFGIKFRTKDFIVHEDYQYEKMDTVYAGDGMIYFENVAGETKPILFPYVFIGDSYRLDGNKVAEYIKEKIIKDL